MASSCESMARTVVAVVALAGSEATQKVKRSCEKSSFTGAECWRGGPKMEPEAARTVQYGNG